jgi:hypothetical protein
MKTAETEGLDYKHGFASPFGQAAHSDMQV